MAARKGKDKGKGSGKSKGGLTLDFASKLAAAGLVSKADADAASAKKQRRASSSHKSPGNDPSSRSSRSSPSRAAQRPAKDGGLTTELRRLATGGKSESYDATRRWVDRGRLDDRGVIPSEHSEPFHFTTAQARLARVYVDAKARDEIAKGNAGITAYMSHHGLAYAVVPRELATAIHQLFPLWLRMLRDHPGAGNYAEPEPAEATEGATAEAATNAKATANGETAANDEADASKDSDHSAP